MWDAEGGHGRLRDVIGSLSRPIREWAAAGGHGRFQTQVIFLASPPFVTVASLIYVTELNDKIRTYTMTIIPE